MRSLRLAVEEEGGERPGSAFTALLRYAGFLQNTIVVGSAHDRDIFWRSMVYFFFVRGDVATPVVCRLLPLTGAVSSRRS